MYSLDCVNFETVKDKNGNDKVSIIIGLDKQMFVINGYHTDVKCIVPSFISKGVDLQASLVMSTVFCHF